jgi:transketolase
MTILSPGDARQTGAAVKAAAAWDGPVYLRVTRGEQDDLPGDGSLEIGKVYPMTEGGDITILATGSMAGRALVAAQKLQEAGITALVANVPTIKPLDTAAIRTLAARTGKVLTCEEHSVIGGLGSAVAEALSSSGIPVRIMGIEDTFGMSANNEPALLEEYRLTWQSIAQRVRALVSDKQ